MVIRKIIINDTKYKLIPQCSAPGCMNRYRVKGLCNIHYQRYIHGIPMEGNKRPTLIERIKSKIVKEKYGGCWLWVGAKNGTKTHRYGAINIDGKIYRVHRIMYEIYNNTKVGKLHVLHKCDNPSCVNPDHLFIGTQQDNVDDMIWKGRDYHPKGEANHSKLTNRDVRQIRWKYKHGVTCAELGRKYSVHPQTIKNIIKRKKWKHI